MLLPIKHLCAVVVAVAHWRFFHVAFSSPHSYWLNVHDEVSVPKCLFVYYLSFKLVNILIIFILGEQVKKGTHIYANCVDWQAKSNCVFISLNKLKRDFKESSWVLSRETSHWFQWAFFFQTFQIKQKYFHDLNQFCIISSSAAFALFLH